MLNLKPFSVLRAVHTVTLFLPALYWPHAGMNCDAPLVPALRTLISRADTADALCDDEQAWLCAQFGVERQADWPVASIALLGTGVPPGAGFWLSADPVHLQVNRDQLVLLAPDILLITDAEANALCAALSLHFATDHMAFVAPQPHRWYLTPEHPAKIRTSGLSKAIGHDVDRMLPQGEDQMAWHRIFNEVQMLLHAHPVNEAREQRGALPINSLWFSGGGTLPSARTPFQAVMGSSVLIRGLAKLAAVPFAAAEQGIDAIAADDVLIELHDAEAASMRMDPAAWKDALEGLERLWFEPLTRLLKKGRIRRIAIATVANGRSYRWSVSRRNLWRLWKPAAALSVPISSP